MQPDADSKMQDMTEVDDDSQWKHLLFVLGGELYGTRLTSVKEVIKMGTVKAVPYMVPHFSGVINLRGQIVSVIDLRKKFQLEPSIAGTEALVLVVEAPTGLIGAVVDDVTSVARITPADVETSRVLETRIPLSFFRGVAKHADRLINLIDIAGCLSAEDYATVQRLKEAL